MAEGDGSKTTKIVLAVIGGVLLLSVICCVGGWLLVPEEAKKMFGQGVEMAQQMAKGVQAFDQGFADDFGEDGRWEFGGAGQEALLLVGVGPDVELDEATVTDLQDKAWTRYASAFAGGGIPVTGVAIGRGGERTGGSSSYQGHVGDWMKNVVDIEELEARTGVAPPPASEFFESVEALERRSGGVQVKVEVEPDEEGPEDPATPEEPAPPDEE